MALYNNGFPATYTPYYTQFAPVQQQGQSVQQNVQNNRVWVQGEAGAKSYLVAPNNTVDLWDSESPVIYIKSADASGLPSIKVLDYVVRNSQNNTANTSPSSTDDKLSSFATKTEINAIYDEIKTIKTRMEKIASKMKEEDDE